MRRLVALPVLLGVLVGACAAPADRAPRASPTRTPAPSEVPPQDRDPAAVAAALDNVDPCRLLDLDIALERGLSSAVTEPGGAGECVLLPQA